jgi:hypothetical protein
VLALCENPFLRWIQVSTEINIGLGREPARHFVRQLLLDQTQLFPNRPDGSHGQSADDPTNRAGNHLSS